MNSTDYKLWANLNDLEAVTITQASTLDTLSYIVDGLDRAAAAVDKKAPESAQAFYVRACAFEQMILAIIDALEKQNRTLAAGIQTAFELTKEARRG